MTHDSVSVEACSSRAIEGSAMFMIDASSTTTNCATARTTSARQRRGSRDVVVVVIVWLQSLADVRSSNTSLWIMQMRYPQAHARAEPARADSRRDAARDPRDRHPPARRGRARGAVAERDRE